MEYTTNYQLPTWVETDRIQMDDFNDMTDKLDAAIAAVNQRIDQVNPVVKLKEVVLTSNQSRVDIDLSDINWSLYREVQVCIECKSTSYDTAKIQINNHTLDNDYRTYDGNGREEYSNSIGTWSVYPDGTNIKGTLLWIPDVAFFNYGVIGDYTRNIFISRGVCVHNNGAPLTTLSIFLQSQQFLAGSLITFYGVKKA